MFDWLKGILGRYISSTQLETPINIDELNLDQLKDIINKKELIID